MLETPAPLAHGLHAPAHVQKTNGVGHAHTHAPPKPVNSDVMQMLNLPGGTEVPGAPPKLISVSATMALAAGTTAAPAPRSKSAIYVLALLGVVAAVVIAVTVTLKKPPKPPVVAVAPPPPPPEPTPPPPEQPPPPPVVEPVQPPPQKGKLGKVRGKQKPIAATPKGPAGPATPPPGGGTDADRFRDNHMMDIKAGSGGTKLPPPAQADIMKVIGNNRSSIKVCYQRALTRDNSLTHGKLAVKLSIGISGRVKHVALDGPTTFRILLEPCIKEVVQRWVFPQASEEYGTEFPLVFQGNE